MNILPIIESCSLFVPPPVMRLILSFLLSYLGMVNDVCLNLGGAL